MTDIDNVSDREECEFFHAEDYPHLFEDRITFGLHNGQLYSYIFEKDFDYFLWLYNNVKTVKKYLKRVLKSKNTKIENNLLIIKA